MQGRRRGEGQAAGERGERSGWIGGEGSLSVSFQDGFYGVTSNADLPHPCPYIPPAPSLHPSVRPSVPPSSFSLLCTAKWTVIGYSFVRLISALSAPTP